MSERAQAKKGGGLSGGKVQKELRGGVRYCEAGRTLLPFSSSAEGQLAGWLLACAQNQRCSGDGRRNQIPSDDSHWGRGDGDGNQNGSERAHALLRRNYTQSHCRRIPIAAARLRRICRFHQDGRATAMCRLRGGGLWATGDGVHYLPDNEINGICLFVVCVLCVVFCVVHRCIVRVDGTERMRHWMTALTATVSALDIVYVFWCTRVFARSMLSYPMQCAGTGAISFASCWEEQQEACGPLAGLSFCGR